MITYTQVNNTLTTIELPSDAMTTADAVVIGQALQDTEHTSISTLEGVSLGAVCLQLGFTAENREWSNTRIIQAMRLRRHWYIV